MPFNHEKSENFNNNNSNNNNGEQQCYSPEAAAQFPAYFKDAKGKTNETNEKHHLRHVTSRVTDRTIKYRFIIRLYVHN